MKKETEVREIIEYYAGQKEANPRKTLQLCFGKSRRQKDGSLQRLAA